MRVFAVSASLCLFLIVSSSAQEPTPRDTASAFELEEILVTATRTSVPILEIPLAVDIVDSRDFASGRKSGLNDLLKSVPGILVQSRAGARDVLSVPSSTVIDGSIGFRFSLSRVSFHTFLGIDNITNRQFAASAFINPSGSATNASFLEPGLPRNFFGGLEFNMSL